MSKFEQMCYLIVQRQKANAKRRHLLYKLRKKMGEYGADDHQRMKPYHCHSYAQMSACKKELKAYRKQADAMKRLSKSIYSPLRRELKAKINYDGSNNCRWVYYDKELFSYKRVKEIADGYLFDEIVLQDNTNIVNPYKELV